MPRGTATGPTGSPSLPASRRHHGDRSLPGRPTPHVAPDLTRESY